VFYKLEIIEISKILNYPTKPYRVLLESYTIWSIIIYKIVYHTHMLYDNPDDTSVNPLNIRCIFDFIFQRKLTASGTTSYISVSMALKNCDYFSRGLNPSRVDTDNTLLRN
jgi:hypothetical protein